MHEAINLGYTPSMRPTAATAKRPEDGSGNQHDSTPDPGQAQRSTSRTDTFYLLTYLVFFSLWGTLARLGLQAVTFYPGAPVTFSEVWANVGGCIVMGFLVQQRSTFEEGAPCEDQSSSLAKKKRQRPAPLYIGLTTGFCGCFTSFSSFMRDAYLALSNRLPPPGSIRKAPAARVAGAGPYVSRNGGYSFMALLAVVLVTVTLSLGGLLLGTHLGLLMPSILNWTRNRRFRVILDRSVALLAIGCWIGAVILAILPPDKQTSSRETWRGRAVFALVFAPIGCLLRYYMSSMLNRRSATFPLGTFAANALGTTVLGMCWDLQHANLGGMLTCQVLQGIQDGFCGCLTTVSTWVSELRSLRLKQAYIYGAVSVLTGLCLMIVIMGSLQWTRGFSDVKCIT